MVTVDQALELKSGMIQPYNFQNPHIDSRELPKNSAYYNLHENIIQFS